MKIKGLYCILPEFETLQEYISFTRKLIKFNPDVIQLRIKNFSDKFFYSVALNIKKILASKKIPFIIDDRVDIALLVKADGVHLGQDDLPAEVVRKLLKIKSKNFIIGVSTHSFQQAKEALKMPVDYISIGPVFPTSTKDYKPVGLQTVKEVVLLAKNKMPVVAIGGINSKNVELLKEIKPSAIAVISALKIADLKREVFKLKSIFK
ncbi:MAG: thiamine phosphate synthase [Endomicrobiia bacterium]